MRNNYKECNIAMKKLVLTVGLNVQGIFPFTCVSKTGQYNMMCVVG